MQLISYDFGNHEELCKFVRDIGLKRENIMCITESTTERTSYGNNYHSPRYTLFYWR